jgi:hypothetical protein
VVTTVDDTVAKEQTEPVMFYPARILKTRQKDAKKNEEDLSKVEGAVHSK